MSPSQRVVIFDLDRTLINCDSFAGCLNSLLLRKWWRLGSVVATSPILLPLWATATTRPIALRSLLWCATVGLKSQELASHVSAHGKWLASQGESTVHNDGLQTLREHQRSGDHVVIVTGSSRDLATAFCAALGLGDVRLVGSTFRAYGGGWIVDDHCAGARKVAMLVAAGVIPPWAVVYTDSVSDLPLLRLAERRCVVNASRRTVRAMTRALGVGRFEVVRWQ